MFFYSSNCNDLLENDNIVLLSSEPRLIRSQNITYELLIDPSKLGSSETVMFDDDSEISGSISFCTKLHTMDSSGLSISSKKLNYNVEFDLSNLAFALEEIEINEQSVEDINMEIMMSVSACECTSSYECVDPLNATTYIQHGTAPEFRVCITPDSTITHVSNMNLQLRSDAGFAYNPVEFGQNGPRTDSLTTLSESVSSASGSITMITTRLIEGLFGGNSISASGIVFLEFGNEAKDTFDDMIEFDLVIRIDRKETDFGENNLNCFKALFSRFFSS